MAKSSSFHLTTSNICQLDITKGNKSTKLGVLFGEDGKYENVNQQLAGNWL
jgi:hypothetical protein